MLISEEEKLREHGIRVKVVGKVFIMFCVFYSRNFHRTFLLRFGTWSMTPPSDSASCVFMYFQLIFSSFLVSLTMRGFPKPLLKTLT